MAQESCNLDKEEAEIIKPSSSPPSNPPPQSSNATCIINPSSSAHAALCLKPPQEFSAQMPSGPGALAEFSSTQKAAEKEHKPPVQFGNRCCNCRKKVGLTGFRCRCGDLFCPRHRYSETHDCSFDYKALGREEISKANPVIKPAKIIKI